MKKFIPLVIILTFPLLCFAQDDTQQPPIRLIHFESESLGGYPVFKDPKTGEKIYGDTLLPRIVEKKIELGILTIKVEVSANCAQEFEGKIEVYNRTINLIYIEKYLSPEKMMKCGGPHDLTYKIKGLSVDNYTFRLNGKEIKFYPNLKMYWSVNLVSPV